MMSFTRCFFMGVAAVVMANCGCVDTPPSKIHEYHPSGAESRQGFQPTLDHAPVKVASTRVASPPVKPHRKAESSDDQPKLSPGDVIDLKVYQEDELTSHVRVNPDGTVVLPLLGAVRVGGKTVEDASEFIREALARDYLRDPHVTLIVAEFAKKRFSVMGEVKMPGFYQIPENEKINVLEALSMAGGYTAFTRGTRIQIKRIVDGNEVVLWVDAQAMARKKNVEPIEVLPGDAITVNSNVF